MFEVKNQIIENELATKVIGVCIEVHKLLGPGLLESAYHEVLFHKLKKAGFNVVKENPMPLIVDEVKLEVGYRIDLLVENRLVIEVKAVEGINEIHLAQTLTYLKLGNYKLSLLVNFNVSLMKNGTRRIIN